MLWTADLLDPLAGLSETDRVKVEEVKIRVKTPTPRILEIKPPPRAFEMAYSKGGAVVTFTSKVKGSLAGLEPQVRRCGLVERGLRADDGSADGERALSTA